MSKEVAKNILNTLVDNGHKAYFVGGCVRDYVLGREAKDYDVATSATPEDISKIFPDSSFVGKSFGVALVNGVEVATFRKDVSCDGRHAEVEFVSDITEDLSRRDFTMNAMALDVNGKLLDPFGGALDIFNKTIRFVGNPLDRIREDYLRALRAVRFAHVLGFSIEEESLKAIQSVRDDIFSKVSSERVLLELEKSFT